MLSLLGEEPVPLASMPGSIYVPVQPRQITGFLSSNGRPGLLLAAGFVVLAGGQGAFEE